MKRIILLITLCFIFSCGNKKIIQLPEINYSEITEINDVSPAYLFYDDTQKDSVELNRKNLISTTNWLVNIDKRLTLKQVTPHIKYLQDKKRNSGHKNKEAKNYFTCNDTSRKNLGFIEFTNVVYHEVSISQFKKNKIEGSKFKQEVYAQVVTLDSIPIHFPIGEYGTIRYSNKENLLNDIESVIINDGEVNLYFGFNKSLSFQDYITIKSILLELENETLTISNNEFIFN